MIFVTVGGNNLGFDRLIIEMDHIAGKINEEVIMQIGASRYEPKNCAYFRYLSKEEFNNYLKNSRILVCHGGAGSIISGFQHNKPTIVFPRVKEYGEILDHQQIELTTELEKDGRIIAIYDIKDLEKAISTQGINSNINIKNNAMLINALKEYIQGISNNRG